MRQPFILTSAMLLSRCLSAQAEPPSQDPLSVHAQLTYQLQGHGGFAAPYEGENSFENRREIRGSFTTTIFLGRRLWPGGEVYANGEFFAGAGVSRVLGLAAPPNGETYRVDSATLKANLARAFFRQTWNLAGATEAVEDAQNLVAGWQSDRRLVLTLGKFSGTDVFDGNSYSHDPRTQFNNWSLWANAAWDYPADTRGYTWGVALEWIHEAWALRCGSLMEPREANQLELDHDVRQARGEVIELSHDHDWAGRKGTVRVLAFRNRARMGVYGDALAVDPLAPDVVATRAPGRTKRGLGLNLEQAFTADAGGFLRMGWNDGDTEAWAFTEVERTISAGVSLGGTPWGRAKDRLGIGLASNGLGASHRAYLFAGGSGFMLGDGRLAYQAERVVDVYYAVALRGWATLSLEAQRFANPAFNRDRGPLTVYGIRLHLQR